MKRLLLRSLLLMSMLFAAAPGVQAQQQSPEISLTVKSQPLTTVLRQLEKSTDYKFMYSNDDLHNRQVTCTVRTHSIHEAMKALLKGLPFDYSVKGKFVYITLKQNLSTAQKSQTKATAVISGIVRDNNGETLPGVTIKIDGVTGGISTREDGSFTIIRAKNEETRLLFSYSRNEDCC